MRGGRFVGFSNMWYENDYKRVPQWPENVPVPVVSDGLPMEVLLAARLQCVLQCSCLFMLCSVALKR